MFTNQLLAQTPKQNFILENNETGTTRNYVARNYVLFKNGFSYAVTSNNSFVARIDTTLRFTITSIPNPVPGDTTNNSNDNTYTPGNTFNDVTGSEPKVISAISGMNGVRGDTLGVYPILWLKTIPVTNNLNGGYQWKDVTNNHIPVYNYSSQGAGHGSEYIITRDKILSFNFNPAINLSYGDISKEILIKNSDLAQTTIIGVWGAKENYDTDNFLFAVNGRKDESVIFTKRYVAQADSAKTNLNYGDNTTRNLLFLNSPIEGSDVNKFREKALRVGTYYRSNRLNTSIWGDSQEAVISLGYKFDATNVNNTSVFNSQWQNLNEFKGYVPELLVFSHQLSPLDCRKYESYLAIKYGISLDTSYISVKGDLIWDYHSNIGYNNRITGYGREDALALYQKVSTTSYEEMPYYSNQISYDSFDSCDSYKLSTPSRLLVIGRQPANYVDDGKYVLFGDNNRSIENKDSLVLGFTGTMSRKWILCTNIENGSDSDKIISWQNMGLTIVEKDNFKSDIIKTPSESAASIVTNDSLKGTDGYFAWTVEQEYGPITVKFGNKQAELTENSYEYGYQISEDGQVHSIQKGIINNYSLFTVEKGQRIEVEKNGRIMFLRINGVRYKNTEFSIDSIHNNKIYYGTISIGLNSSEIKLSDFRHGGFVNSGNRIELSYLGQRASDFVDYKDQRTYLIIDRSGDGDFKEGATESYPCDEFDELRSKIIFNNIFWDTDANGKDAFTFGYIYPALLRSAKDEEPDEKPKPEQNGLNDIQIYYKNINDLSSVTVKIQMEKPSKATILVYDLLGKQIDRKVLTENSTIRVADINLPDVGLYIIKVITDQMEYSQEVISRM